MSCHDVSVFWDFENCSVPANRSGFDIVNKLRDTLHPHGPIHQLRAYMSLSSSPLTPKTMSLRSELQLSGVTLVDVPHNGRKNAVDLMMIVDMLTYCMDRHSPTTVVLISADRDFAYPMATIRLRGFRVIIVSPMGHGTHPSLLSPASIFMSWYDVVGGNTPSHLSERPPPTPLSGPHQRKPSSSEQCSEGSHNTVLFKWQSPLQSFRSQESPLAQSPTIFASYPSAPTAPSSSTNSKGLSATPLTVKQTRSSGDVPLSNEEALHLGSELESALPMQCTSTSDSDYADSGATNSIGPDEISPIGPALIAHKHPPGNVEDETMSDAVDCVISAVARQTDHAGSDQISDPSTCSAFEGEHRRLCSPKTSSEPVKSLTVGEPRPELTSSAKFKPLLDLLGQFKAEGHSRPLRSSVAFLLKSNNPDVYKFAGTKSWTDYAQLAMNAKHIVLGGTHGTAWVSLADRQDSIKLDWSVFDPLVQILCHLRDEGIHQADRSQVAIALVASAKHIYAQAGVSTFKEYSSRAVDAGIVRMGSAPNGGAWISLAAT